MEDIAFIDVEIKKPSVWSNSPEEFKKKIQTAKSIILNGHT
jgi:hypothetical protein